MKFLKKYLSIGTPGWEITVKYSLKIGLVLGLFVGFVVLLKIL